jgi:hypothetical protein
LLVEFAREAHFTILFRTTVGRMRRLYGDNTLVYTVKMPEHLCSSFFPEEIATWHRYE